MNRSRNIVAAMLALALSFGMSARAQANAVAIPVEFDLSKIQLTGQITLKAVPLPFQAFTGKSIVIPVQITSDALITDPSVIQASLFYQLEDASDNPLGAWQNVPVQLQLDPSNKMQLLGTAIVPRTDYQSADSGGHIKYYFHAQKGSQNVFLTPSLTGLTISTQTAPVDSFDVALINTMQFSVPANGGNFHINDTYQVDGKTAVNFDPGALSGPGTLVITQLDPNSVPEYRGLKPVAVFTFDLENTSLVRSAYVTLSYPANTDGSVIGADNEKLNEQNLNIYTLSSLTDPNGWQILSRPTTDPTLHTVTGFTTHFSMFALFATGATGAADLRPMQRILTPNGDGINDTISFNGLTSSDEVRLFDVRGRRVRTVSGPPHIWDGRDDSGHIVESGVYIYQYTSGGERISGVIVVAK